MLRRFLRRFGYALGYEDCRARCVEIIDQIMRDSMPLPIDKHIYGRAAGELFKVAILVDRNTALGIEGE